jgi:anaerobic sulfite reductase subunit A
MGYRLSIDRMDQILKQVKDDYTVFAPKVFPGEGTFSDTDRIRYGTVQSLREIEFAEKSHYSFKEAISPSSETLFFYTEDQVTVPQPESKGQIIFLRSCDIHSLRRLDQIYLDNVFEDFYYRRLRDKIKLVLIGCPQSFDNCFCASMGTNQTDQYDAAIRLDGDDVLIDCKDTWFDSLVADAASEKLPVEPDYVTENAVKVDIPDNLDLKIMDSSIWGEYAQRCIACGRCNFVCPTCTCFTMQDIFYKDNARVGERRRVWASCHVDGYTDMAGGMKFRDDKGQRMRFKVLHKVHDFKKRFGYSMCTGCGRCDDICPEYISYSACINKLAGAMQEVSK